MLPFCWVSAETFFLLFASAAKAGSFYSHPEFFFFSAGAFLLSLLFLLARHSTVLLWLYVAGHELTHAFFALVFRAKVSKIHISPEGGHILTDKNNFVISLSPYFFPFYTVLGILVWAILEWRFFDFTEQDRFWLYAIVGFTWMFHVAYTLRMLRRKQSDVTPYGRLLSFAVILLVNLVLISVLFVVASPEATMNSLARAWWENLLSLGDRAELSWKEMFVR